MTNRLPELFPSLKTILWHYSEAGHGKGAPDGIGGTLKRTADRVVAEGNDICNFDDLFTTLSQKIENIKLIEIQHENMSRLSKKIGGLMKKTPNRKHLRAPSNVGQIIQHNHVQVTLVFGL